MISAWWLLLLLPAAAIVGIWLWAEWEIRCAKRPRDSKED